MTLSLVAVFIPLLLMGGIGAAYDPATGEGTVGKLLPGVSAFKVVADTYPAGTLSGAPKYRAMEIIDENEKTKLDVLTTTKAKYLTRQLIPWLQLIERYHAIIDFGTNSLYMKN